MELKPSFNIDKAQYLENINVKAATFDLALGHEQRGEDTSAYWEKIPDLARQYR